jgi:hypothetical protein
MRPGARREYVRRLRETADTLRKTAEEVETAELPDLRRVGIGWGGNGCEIDVGGTYVFKMPRDERHIVDIIRSLAWGLFEARRASSDPRDPKALGEVCEILRGVGLEILTHRRAPCPRCNGHKHICVACDGECKVSLNPDRLVHDRTQALCPNCSAWLAPQAPR